MKKVLKAIFPVAGMGTRFLPATKVVPKEMLPLVDRPLIQNAMDEARDSGIQEFIFVSTAGKESLETHFQPHDKLMKSLEAGNKTALIELLKTADVEAGKLSVTHQAEPLGFGHAVWCARDFVGDEPFAILLPDDVVLSKTPCLKQMIDVYNEVGGNIVAVEDVPREHTQRYGILDVESDNGKLAKVRGLVEKPKPEDAPSTLSIIGRYILQPEVFGHLDKKERGAGGEIQLTDSMAKLIGAQPFHGLRFEGIRYDCGDKVGWLEANFAFALQRADIGPEIRRRMVRLLENSPTP